MAECYLLDQEIVKQVKWTGDSESYDLELRKLGPRGEPFIVQNPWVSDSRPFYFIDDIPDTESCVVWIYKEEWQAKHFPVGWQPSDGYLTVEIEIPQFIWRKNPDLDRAMIFTEDIFGNFKPDSWQAQHELIWYIDPRFNPLDDKVWAISCKPVGKTVLGIMDMGYVAPEVDIEYNEDLPQFELDIDSMMPAYWDLAYTCAYKLDARHELDKEMWVVRISPAYRRSAGWRWYGVISPAFDYTYNKDLPDLDIDLDLDIPFHDLFFEQVWYLSRDFLDPEQEDIWIVKVKCIKAVQGQKNRGYLIPNCIIDINSDLGDLNFNIDYQIPWYDLKYTHTWYLDPRYCRDIVDKIWAMRLRYTKHVSEVKHLDYIEPTARIKINPDLKNINFPSLDIFIQYYDFKYTNVLYLDQLHVPDVEIWAIKIDYVTDSAGYKKIGKIKPKPIIEYNEDLPNIKFKVDYEIPYYDRNYLHIWYLKNNDENIWLAQSAISTKTKGQKVVDYVEPIYPDYLDVVFISYHEPNAEQNWQRVKEFAPWAKRVLNIEGIDRAHRAAAELSETDMFYVVDGDAWLVDSWKFDFQPSIFDRDCTYIWMSKNPFNELDYGYGGVKLFNRNSLLKIRSWKTLDFTMTANRYLKVSDQISNVSLFNVDEFSTWRSAFREGVKLSQNKDTERLDNWVTNLTAPYADMAVLGISEARSFYDKNKNNPKKLIMINNRKWLREYFEKLKK